MARISDHEADRQHVERVQTLFVQHTPALRGFILSLLPDFAAADDVLQETFITATARAAQFELGTSFLRWSCAIAHFKVLEGARSRKEIPTLAPDVIDALCACMPDQEDTDELRTRLLGECLDELAPQARRAVALRYEYAHKPAEVARLMGWTAEAVYVALSRARAVLRTCVKEKVHRLET